jgi:hypothetical protein
MPRIPVLLILAMAGVTAVAVLLLTARSHSGEHTPASQIISGFRNEEDREFGYSMLVPTGWESVNLGSARGYTPPSQAGATDGVSLTAANLRTIGESPGENAQLLPYELFKRNPSLSAWTDSVAESWRQNGIAAQEQDSLPNARIYSVVPAKGQVQLVAYAIDGDQPLAVQLIGRGRYGTVEGLRDAGLFEDFKTMVESVRVH